MFNSMLKKLLLLLVAILSILALAGCDTLYGRNEAGWAVQQTGDGGYIVAGDIEHNRKSRPSDAFLIKTDHQGNEQWARVFGTGSEDNHFSSVQQTDDGGYIVAGRTVFHRPGYPFATLLIKTDHQGNEEWYRVFDDRNESSWAKHTEQTEDGGYILAGYRRAGPGGSWTYDALLIKTDYLANEEWSQTFDRDDQNGRSESYAYCAQQTSDGGYILAGRMWNLDEGSTGLLIKADHRGNEEWYRVFTEIDRFNSVQQSQDGGYILASSQGHLIKTDHQGNEEWSGTFEEAWDIYVQQTKDGGYILASSQGYLIKTDYRGNEEWSRKFEVSRANSLQQTGDGGYILTGTTESDDVISAWLLKTDSQGIEEWNRAFGGSPPRPYTLTLIALLVLPVLNFIYYLFFYKDMKVRGENRLIWCLKYLVMGPLAVTWYKTYRKPKAGEGDPPHPGHIGRKHLLHNLAKHLIFPWSVYVLLLPLIFMLLVTLSENPQSHAIGEYIFWLGLVYFIVVIPLWFISTLVIFIIRQANMPKKEII